LERLTRGSFGPFELPDLGDASPRGDATPRESTQAKSHKRRPLGRKQRGPEPARPPGAADNGARQRASAAWPATHILARAGEGAATLRRDPGHGAALGFTFDTRVSCVLEPCPQPKSRPHPDPLSSRRVTGSGSRFVRSCEDRDVRRAPDVRSDAKSLGAPTTACACPIVVAGSLSVSAQRAQVRLRVSRETTAYPHSLTRSEPPRRSHRQTRSSAQMTAVPMRSITSTTISRARWLGQQTRSWI
jgi:hypothetical protein